MTLCSLPFCVKNKPKQWINRLHRRQRCCPFTMVSWRGRGCSSATLRLLTSAESPNSSRKLNACVSLQLQAIGPKEADCGSECESIYWRQRKNKASVSTAPMANIQHVHCRSLHRSPRRANRCLNQPLPHFWGDFKTVATLHWAIYDHLVL